MKNIRVLFAISYFLFNSSLFSQVFLTKLNCPGGIPTSLYVDKTTDAFYAGCWGGIWKYNSTQNDWTEVDSDPDSNILANAKITAMYIDSKGVFYAGTDGTTQSYISFDGGKKWSQIANAIFTLQNVTCIIENSNGSVFVATNFGILTSSNNGRTWNKLKNSPTNVNCLFNSNGTMYAGASNGMYCTQSNDTTWVKVTLPGFARAVYSITRNSKGIIFAGANGDLYRSDDDGLNWYSIGSNVGANPVISWIHITKDDFIYALTGVAGMGVMLRSRDDGLKWDNLATQYQPQEMLGPSFVQVVSKSTGNLYGLSTRYGALEIMDNFVGVEDEVELPKNIILFQNYPNPFNPTTAISYQLSAFSRVKLIVYDLLGREITTLVNEEKSPGNYEVKFNSETRRGESLPSGVYFYRLTAGSFSQTKKMLLMK